MVIVIEKMELVGIHLTDKPIHKDWRITHIKKEDEDWHEI